MANKNRYKQKQPKNFDKEAIEGIDRALQQSQKNPQPFLAVSDEGKAVVVGNADDVDTVSDYIVDFEYPASMKKAFDDYVDNEDGTITVSRSFNEVKLTPRKSRRIRHAVSVLMTGFSKVTTQGGREVMTIGDVASRYEVLDDSITEAMENILQVVLGITDMDMEYVSDESLISVVSDLIQRNSGFFQRNS